MTKKIARMIAKEAWLGALLAMGAGACATEAVTTFGDPARVTTSGGLTGTLPPSGPACTPNFACAVSWKKDIYDPIINSVAVNPPGGACTANNCHLTPNGKLQVDPNDHSQAYSALLNFANEALGGRYVTPCAAKDSAIFCNFDFAGTVANQFAPNGACGSKMPKFGMGSPAKLPFNQAQYQNLVTWIQECGAPKN